MAINNNQWAIILGGSSGIGLATAFKLAENNFNLIIVHRDRGNKLIEFEQQLQVIKEKGIEVLSLNTNIISSSFKEKFSELLSRHKLQKKIRLMLHSISMGNLGGISHTDDKPLSKDDFLVTIESMGLSFWDIGDWLSKGGFYSEKASLIGLTSEGSTKAFDYYAAVATAKGTLENISRYMAKVFMKQGINVNLINAGVVNTEALEFIPNKENFLETVKENNPGGRITTAQDVANVIYLFTKPETAWINGSIIRVDGGEQIC